MNATKVLFHLIKSIDNWCKIFRSQLEHVWSTLHLSYHLVGILTKAVIFTNYYASEFDTKLEEFTELEMSINGIKKRTAKGYALKDTAVWWLFSQYKETLESGGYSWDRYVEVCLKNYFFSWNIYPFSTSITNRKIQYKLFIKNCHRPLLFVSDTSMAS